MKPDINCRKMKNLKFYRSGLNFYTSHSNLNELAKSKYINAEVIAQRSGLHWVVSTIRYTTHYGLVLAELEKDSTIGFCSQAYGVKIPVGNLKCPKKSAIEFDIYERERKVLRKNNIIRKIAFKERGIESFN